jgi:hypothetical protein
VWLERVLGFDGRSRGSRVTSRGGHDGRSRGSCVTSRGGHDGRSRGSSVTSRANHDRPPVVLRGLTVVLTH